MPVDVTVKGQIEARDKLLQVAADLHGEPMITAMRTATLIVERDAKLNAPVDTGRLRASIASEVRTSGIGGQDVTGVVGSNVTYAAAMEVGSRPHWPPIGALDVWARRHGMNAFLVARAIARRGTKPRRYLQRAFEANTPRIISILGVAVTGIVNQP